MGGIRELSATVIMGILRCFGHVQIMDEVRIVKMFMKSDVTGIRLMYMGVKYS